MQVAPVARNNSPGLDWRILNAPRRSENARNSSKSWYLCRLQSGGKAETLREYLISGLTGQKPVSLDKFGDDDRSTTDLRRTAGTRVSSNRAASWRRCRRRSCASGRNWTAFAAKASAARPLLSARGRPNPTPNAPATQGRRATRHPRPSPAAPTGPDRRSPWRHPLPPACPDCGGTLHRDRDHDPIPDRDPARRPLRPAVHHSRRLLRPVAVAASRGVSFILASRTSGRHRGRCQPTRPRRPGRRQVPLNKERGLPHGKIAQTFDVLFGIDLSRGALLPQS